MNLDGFKFIDDFSVEDESDDYVPALEKYLEQVAKKRPELNPILVHEYSGYVEEISCFYDRQKDKRHELEPQCEMEVAFKTYGRGGTTLHRGFHCPSPVMDLMIGGCNRGTEVKKLRKESGNYYLYYWNTHGKLLRVDKFYDSLHLDTEYVIDLGNKRFGITFYASGEISEEPKFLSMEEYTADGKILKYITILPDFKSRRKDHEIYAAEKYLYNDAGLLTQVTFASGNIRQKSLIEVESDIVYGSKGKMIGYERNGRVYPGSIRNRK